MASMAVAHCCVTPARACSASLAPSIPGRISLARVIEGMRPLPSSMMTQGQRKTKNSRRMGCCAAVSPAKASADGDSIKIPFSILYTKAGEVAFAECGKDFVDFLVGFTQLPVASVLKLLKDGDKMNGQGNPPTALDNILESVRKSDSRYLKVPKGPLLDPRTRVASTTPRLLKQPAHTPHAQTHVRSSYSSEHRCSDCGYSIPVSRSQCEDCTTQRQGDFVEEKVTYIVTNELDFFPTTFIAGTRILNQKGIKSFDDLHSVEFMLDADKALELVKAAIWSDRPLSDVFALPPDQIMTDRPYVDVAVFETVE